MSISILIIAKNEANNIKKNFYWLEKCPNIDDIVLIDDYSSDKTKIAIPKATIIKHHLNNNFAAQRNFGLSKTKNDYVLILDADETPSPELIQFIANFKESDQDYAFRRTEIFLGHELKHGETGNFYTTRLINKTTGNFVRPVHEIWESPTPTKKLNLRIYHYSHFALKSFLEKINFYSTIRAKELFDTNTKTNLFQIILYPKAKFIKNYILKFGFLDGTPGLIMALSMSFHSFLVRAKLWHMQQQ